MASDAAEGTRVASSPCPGCGLVLRHADSGTHAYIGASPACWAVYGEVLAREYTDPRYFAMHSYTVDAYAAQHPGTDGRRQRQSVAVHLVGLYLLLEQGDTHASVMPSTRQRLVERKDEWPWLAPPPADAWRMTVTDVVGAAGPEEHERLVRQWAQAVWDGWHEHHETVRGWAVAATGG